MFREISSGNDLPLPIEVTASQANSSNYEGTLIAITGNITAISPVSTNGNNYTIDDLTAVMIWNSTGIDVSALTVGYRGSLTEIIQIIGRATRDSDNKSHAQFTNLIAQPDAADNLVKVSVNNMLKAITASLLMEQVLAPNWKFKTKVSEDDKAKPGEIKIRGLKEPSSQRVKDIVEDSVI